MDPDEINALIRGYMPDLNATDLVTETKIAIGHMMADILFVCPVQEAAELLDSHGVKVRLHNEKILLKYSSVFGCRDVGKSRNTFSQTCQVVRINLSESFFNGQIMTREARRTGSGGSLGPQ